MFANSIFEALYLFKALYVNHAISDFIQESPVIFKLLYLVSSFVLLKTIFTIKDFSKSNLHRPNSTPFAIGNYIIVFFVSMSILSYTTKTSIYDFQKYNWKESKLLKSNMSDELHQHLQSYEIPTMLYFAMKLVGNIEYVITRFIDEKFNPTDKYSESPNGLYRAFVHAGYSQITDTRLASKLDYYQSECINPIITKIQNQKAIDKIVDTSMFGKSNNQKINELFKKQKTSLNESCESYKNRINRQLKAYLKINNRASYDLIERSVIKNMKNTSLQVKKKLIENYVFSAVLNNHINQKSKDSLIENEAQVDGLTVIWQFITSPFVKNNLGGSGTASAASEANKFSQQIKQAPHLKGAILFLLIGGFPILVFLILLFGFKPLKYWFMTYFFVSMWTPIWALLYAVNIGFLKNSSFILQLQSFSDGLSFHTAAAINSQIMHSYTVFLWSQTAVVGATFIGIVGTIFSSISSNPTSDNTPQEAKSIVSTGAKFTGSVL